MHGDLSHGLPGLVTSGNRILRADTNQPVLLRGVNRSGLEYTEPVEAGFLAAAEFTEVEAREMAGNWRCNLVRIPFNQDWALYGRRGHTPEEYLASLDQVIAWLAALGAYTILDLQWLDSDTVYGHTAGPTGAPVDNHIAPTPNLDTIALWRLLAERYQDEPAVIFDLFNEPHDRLPDDYLPIHIIGGGNPVVESDSAIVGPREWTAWAGHLVAEIQAIRPAGLILVEGIAWGFDLREIRIDAPNIVYSTHIYQGPAPATWGRALGRAGDVPLLVGEWGGTDAHLDFGRRLAAVLRDLGVGWTAWSWVDYPRLIQKPRAPAFRPTPFGDLVRGELAQ